MKKYFTMALVAYVYTIFIASSAVAMELAGSVPNLRASELPNTVSAQTGDVLSGSLDPAFVPIVGSKLTSSKTNDRWFRVSLDADWTESEPAVLAIVDAGYTRFRIYLPPGYQEQRLWHEKPNESARFSRHAQALALPLNLKANQAIYLAIDETLTTKHPRLAIAPLSAYQADDLAHVRLTTLFASVQLVMVLVGFSLWLTLRDRVFAYFVGYAGLQLIYQMLVSGEVYDLPFGNLLSPMGQRAAWFFATTSAILSISFILEFCSMHRTSPRLATLLSASRWPFAGAAALMLLPLDTLAPLLQNFVNLLFLASSLLAIAAVARLAGRGNRAARFFLIAWMPQVAFTVFRVTQLLLVLPQPPWIEYGFPFTMAFSSIVITVGLADATLHARRERDIAHRLAERDGLTGVLNRRALNARLANLIALVQPDGGRLALLFLDIDHFKEINDRHGHLAGDACLKAVARAASATLPDHKNFGRYGGEEFLAILPGASKAEASAIAERMRLAVESLPIETDGVELKVTASIGIACLANATETPDQLVERADRALYQAKAEGRNRVGIHSPVPAGI